MAATRPRAGGATWPRITTVRRCPAAVRAGRGGASAGGISILFRRLTGLADGLAPKERRYVRPARFAPVSWVPRFPLGGEQEFSGRCAGRSYAADASRAPASARCYGDRRRNRAAARAKPRRRCGTICRRRPRRTPPRRRRPRPARCRRASCRCRAGGRSRPRRATSALGRLAAGRGSGRPCRWRARRRACGSSRSARRRSPGRAAPARVSCDRRAVDASRPRCRGCPTSSSTGTAIADPRRRRRRRRSTAVRRLPRLCDCSVARAPRGPPRSAMKNSTSADDDPEREKCERWRAWPLRTLP